MGASDICNGDQCNYDSVYPDTGCAAAGCFVALDGLVCIEEVYIAV